MADELQLQITATQSKNGVIFSKIFSESIDVSGNNPASIIQNINTADETLDLADVGTLGYFAFRNLDATNFIEIGHTSGTYQVKLKAGEMGIFRVGSGMTAIHAIANTAACNLEYMIIPD